MFAKDKHSNLYSLINSWCVLLTFVVFDQTLIDVAFICVKCYHLVFYKQLDHCIGLLSDYKQIWDQTKYFSNSNFTKIIIEPVARNKLCLLLRI